MAVAIPDFFICRYGGNIAPCMLSRCTLTAGRKRNPQKVESTPIFFLMGGNISATIYFFAVFASFNAL